MKDLLIDDVRNFGCCKTVRTYDEAINALKEEKWDVVYLDHDLGYDPKTGYDILCWLEQNLQYLPGKIVIVSMNPSGRERMQLVIDKLYNMEA
jgi:response regulator of citrate/malate metabolism